MNYNNAAGSAATFEATLFKRQTDAYKKRILKPFEVLRNHFLSGNLSKRLSRPFIG